MLPLLFFFFWANLKDMSFVFYNTLGRSRQDFQPLEKGKVGFYGCGPTVYNYAHIGNLRAYILHDTLVRALRRGGYEVNHVMNITDVGHLSGDSDHGEDKMVKSAEEKGKSVLEIADYYTKAFFNDTDKMNILRPSVVCKATEHIPQMIEIIRRIEEKGCTYFSGGNLYFDISQFPNYGELALLRLDEQGHTRTGVDENKRNPQDFVLWFTKSKFESRALVWDSPWGRGYPGWHIECSAMSMEHLGEQFDIHAGGIDHIPVHHTNEIAQSETAFGKRPWVKYWLHNEFLILDKGKMSKSTGGFVTLQNLADEGFDPLDYRYFLLGGHYRSQLNFSHESLQGAKSSRKSLMDKIRSLDSGAAGAGAAGGAEIPAGSAAEKRLKAFDAAMQDDLSTPRALAELWGLLKDDSPPAQTLAAVFQMDEVLGLSLESAYNEQKKDCENLDSGFAEEVQKLIDRRAQAKKAKDFAQADGIRLELKERGVILEDRAEGTVWRRV